MRVSWKIILVCLILGCIHFFILRQLDQHFPWGNRTITEKWIDLKENYADVNTLVVGTSKAYRGFVPEVFDSIVNPTVAMKSYNFGIPAMFPVEAYHLLDYILEDTTLSLSYVLVELNSVQMRKNLVGFPRGKYFLNAENFVFGMKALWQSELNKRGKWVCSVHFTRNFLERQTLYGMLEEYRTNVLHFDSTRMLPLTYHQRGWLSYEREWEETEKDNQNRLNRKRQSMLKDTSVIRKKLAVNLPAVAGKSNDAHLERIEYLIQKGKARGIEVVFFTMQQQKNYNNHLEVMALVNQIDSRHRIDLMSAKLFPALYVAENLYNAEHLNEGGASVFTTLLADAFLKL